MARALFDAIAGRVRTEDAVDADGAAKGTRDGKGGDLSWCDFTWNAVGAATGVTVAWSIDRARQR